MNIEIHNEQRRIQIDIEEIKKVPEKFLRYLKQKNNSSLNIIFVTTPKIKRINKKYFKKDKITDVIAIEPGSFDKNPKQVFSSYLGDIIICTQAAKGNSKIFNTTLEKELNLYVAHGILHLLGYDDLTKKNRSKMRKKERELLDIL